MEYVNSEGIPIDQLDLALRTPALVKSARKNDSCLLCKRPRVNAAGICDYCYSQLDEPSLRLATRWLSGVGP